MEASPAETSAPWKSRAHVVLSSLIIILALVAYGLYQERIMSQPYIHSTAGGPGIKDYYFEWTLLPVMISRLFAIVFAFIMIFVADEPLLLALPFWSYFLLALPTLFASVCQLEALKYVTFTTMMLAKSFQAVAVMLLGGMFFKKKYTWTDTISTSFTSMGVIVYMVTGSLAPAHPQGPTWLGMFFLVSFTLLDAMAALFEEAVFKQFRATKYNQMFYTNLVSCAAAGIAFGTSYRGAFHAFRFLGHHPVIMMDICTMSAVAIVAQFCTFAQLQNFGMSAFTSTMRVRQLCSIAASHLVFVHPMPTVAQIAGLGLVFLVGTLQSLASFWAWCTEEAEPLLPKTAAPSQDDAEKTPLLKKTSAAACCFDPFRSAAALRGAGSVTKQLGVMAAAGEVNVLPGVLDDGRRG